MKGTGYDSYGKATYDDAYGNTNSGSSYWVSPEGEKFTLTWTADENGFQPKGDHLPVAPALPYHRTGAGSSIYHKNMYCYLCSSSVIIDTVTIQPANEN